MTHPGLRPRRGVAIVEFAACLPLLVFFFVIAVDYGRVFYYSLIVENCARNGALYAGDPLAAAQSPYANLGEAALADGADLQPPPSVTTVNGVDDLGNSYVEVTVTWQFQTIVTYPGVPEATSIIRTVRMRAVPVTPN